MYVKKILTTSVSYYGSLYDMVKVLRKWFDFLVLNGNGLNYLLTIINNFNESFYIIDQFK